MAVERTFFMVKPDGVKRYLSNLILSKITESGFKILARRRTMVTREQAEELYSVHKGKPFYDGLINFITSGPVIMTVVEGERCRQPHKGNDGNDRPEGSSVPALSGATI